MVRVYCFTGYPGAGKSAASSVADDLGHPVVEMGAVVRDHASEELGDDFTSGELGDWATDHREAHGNDIFARYTADAVDDLDAEVIVIDGLRTGTELDVFRDRFDEATVVYVTADFKTRLQRLRSRGRDDEAEFTAADLRNRDAKEAKWGLEELIEGGRYDVELSNEGSFDEFRGAVRDLLETERSAAA